MYQRRHRKDGCDSVVTKEERRKLRLKEDNEDNGPVDVGRQV